MNKAEFMARWLKERKEACGLRAAALAADDRADEAKFEKIRGNIFEIFLTVLTVGQNTCGDETAVLAFFRERLEQIPTSWSAASEKAAQHGDIKAQHIEDLKLGAVREIRAKLTQIMEEAQ